MFLPPATSCLNPYIIRLFWQIYIRAIEKDKLNFFSFKLAVLYFSEIQLSSFSVKMRNLQPKIHIYSYLL